MAQQRLPKVNQDDGVWGDILRQYLMKEHYDDGTDNLTENGGHQKITVRAGTASAGTAPIKLASGTRMVSAEAGAIEFENNDLYFTITTGNARKKVALIDEASPGATGDVYYRNGSGIFTRLGIGADGQQLTAVSGSPAWADTKYPTAAKSSNYTVTATDTVIFADATSANVTITLPAASSFSGYRFYIKRIDGSTNTCTVSAGAGTIDGQTSFTIDQQYTSVMVVSNGTAWYIL